MLKEDADDCILVQTSLELQQKPILICQVELEMGDVETGFRVLKDIYRVFCLLVQRNCLAGKKF